MSETTAIGWTDATELVVNGLMTGFAKRQPVADFKPEVRMIGKRLHVVSVEIAATIISAPLAGEAVAGEYVGAPSLILRGEAEPAALHQLSVFKRMAGAATWIRLAFGRAHLPARFLAMATPSHRTGAASSPLGQSGLDLWRMRPSFEGARTPARVDALLDPVAFETLRFRAITSRAVARIHRDRLPRLANPATLQPRRAEPKIFIERHAGSGRGILRRANGGLRHG